MVEKRMIKNLFSRAKFINSHQNRFQLSMNHFCTLAGKLSAKTIYLVWAKMKQDALVVVVVVVVVVVAIVVDDDDVAQVVSDHTKRTKSVKFKKNNA